MPPPKPPKRVLIVGAGAAGMSAAHQLSQHPSLFSVTLAEAQPYCGGQAFSIPLDGEKFGADWLNQGVQGGSHIFRHTLYMMRMMGHDVKPVQLQVSFGNNERFWSNVFPTNMVEKHRKEIKKFAKAMKTVKRLELVVGMLSVRTFLKLWRFSREFGDYMVLPTLALFLGTGNETERVPVVILEKLFTNPTYGMWYPGDQERMVGNAPPMLVFPRLGQFYSDWKERLEANGVDFRLSTEVTGVIKRSKKGVTVKMRKKSPSTSPNEQDGVENAQGREEEEETTEQFDELILAVLADTALKVLGKTATYRERFVLGSAKFADDITVTHCDEEYMRKYYIPDATQAQQYIPDVSTMNDKDKTRVDRGKQFAPMYFIRPYDEQSNRLEMGFDCSNYQGQFPRTPNASPHNNDLKSTATGNVDERNETPGLEVSKLPLDRHVFQTIFLNKHRDAHLWTRSEINPDKIIREDWWHQLCHSWTHYAFVVPWIFLLNSNSFMGKVLGSSSTRKSTRFAGSWTLVNAHEVAVMSGLAAAWSLGAGYPEDEIGRMEEEYIAKLAGDMGVDLQAEVGGKNKKGGGKWKGFAVLCFKLYCMLTYGRWYKKQGKTKKD